MVFLDTWLHLTSIIFLEGLSHVLIKYTDHSDRPQKYPPVGKAGVHVPLFQRGRQSRLA